MFCDLNLGKVTKLDPDSKHPNLNVQGAVTATQVIFRDFGSNNADEDIVMRRKVLEAHQEKSADFLFLSSTAEVNPITESVESQSVGFFRQVGLESQGDGSISISEVFTVKLGVDDIQQGGVLVPNKGHITIEVAGVSSDFRVKAQQGKGSAKLSFVEEDPVTMKPASEFSFASVDGNLNVLGDKYSILALKDDRRLISPSAIGRDARFLASYEKDPRVVFHATEDGGADLILTAPPGRGIGFVEGATAARFLLNQGDTSFSISNTPMETVDEIAFAMGNDPLMKFSKEGIQFMPYEFSGVKIGKDTVDANGDRIFVGADLSVAMMSMRYLTGANSKFFKSLEAQNAAEPLSETVMEITTDGGGKGGEPQLPLILSGTYVTANAPSFFVGDTTPGTRVSLTGTQGDGTGGVLELNGRGIMQTGLDSPLLLKSAPDEESLETQASAGQTGVALAGAYKLQVGAITLLDTEDGRSGQGEEARSKPRITSKGTLRLTTFDTALTDSQPTLRNEMVNYGDGASNDDMNSAMSEVYIDGNEAPGQARLRVGNAIIHDGFSGTSKAISEGYPVAKMVGSSSTSVKVDSVENVKRALLIAVGGSDADGEVAVYGAPGELDETNPAPADTMHSGMIVIRSAAEVRMDDASRLRLGVPSTSMGVDRGSMVIDGKRQTIVADDESESLQLHAHLGVEIGKAPHEEGASGSGLSRAMLRDKATYADYPELGVDGHPALILRDIEVDGCAMPYDTPYPSQAPTDEFVKEIYEKTKACVSRLGILQFTGTQLTGTKYFGKYDNSNGATAEGFKELYVSSKNFVDFDSRSRVKIGGLFIDGLGAQPDDVLNQFSETRDFTSAAQWTYQDGDSRNTVRGDFGVNLDGGRLGGNMTISGGLSRDDAVDGGSINVLTGGGGKTGWGGSSGHLTLGSAPAGLAAGDTPADLTHSGDASLSTGEAAKGSSGTINIFSGASKAGAGATTGGISPFTGSSEAGGAGNISVVAGASKGDGQGWPYHGGGISLETGAGSGGNADGGAFEVLVGNSTQAAGGVVSITAGASNAGPNNVLDPTGGNVSIEASFSKSYKGGSIELISGYSQATSERSGVAPVDEGLKLDGWLGSGDILASTPAVAASHSGSIALNTGNSTSRVAGNIDLTTGTGLASGSNITLQAGDVTEDSAAASLAEGSNANYFKGQRGLAFYQGAPMAGGLSFKGGSAPGQLGFGGNVTLTGGSGGNFGGHLVMTGGNVTERVTQAAKMYGGGITLMSGSGAAGPIHSGGIELITQNSGSEGGAGAIELTTGNSSMAFNCAGPRGTATEKCIGSNITLSAGENRELDGAFLSLSAGDSTVKDHPPLQGSRRFTPRGGPIVMEAGGAAFGVGGQINLTGGYGSGVPDRATFLTPLRYAADDNLFEFGTDRVGYGGNVTISGGASQYDHGGSVNLISGLPGSSDLSTSGNITLTTADARNTKPTGQTPNGPNLGERGDLPPHRRGTREIGERHHLHGQLDPDHRHHQAPRGFQ